MKNKLNVAMIGCGFMGRTHSNAYLNVNKFFDLSYEPVRKIVTGLSEEEVRPFAERWGWEEHTTDWRKVIERKDIDWVDVCVPNYKHHEIVMAAMAAGKIVTCEKPLAMNTREAQEMVDAADRNSKPNMIWYNYRGVPAITLAKQIVQEGRLGRIFHYRGFFLQDWTINPNVPVGGNATWRLDMNIAGSGVTGDLLAHTFDLALWLNGPLNSLTAMTETFIRERPRADDPSRKSAIGIDDAAAALARFRNGSLGIFESTRYACGRKGQNVVEIYGEKGGLMWDMGILHELYYYNHGDESQVRGWRTISVWDSDQPYMKHWWVPGCQIGYEHTFIHLLADFLDGLVKNEKKSPDFHDGLATQIVCDSLLESAKCGQWVNVR
jgi:predicted dehydrogenase